MEIQLVIFKLGNETYGVEISTVQSIIKMQVITRLPQAPDFIEGVTNLRGKILPVVDLRKRLGLALAEITRASRIIIVDLSGTTVGMIVDSVAEVLRINEDVVEPPPMFTDSGHSEYIQGIAKYGSDLIILLEIGKVLETYETAALAQAVAA